MGPLEGLVELAITRRFPAFAERVTASKKTTLVRMDIEVDGRATFSVLSEGATAYGPGAQRTGEALRPRLFRDDVQYTIKNKQKRKVYREQVEILHSKRPRAALKAFIACLSRAPRLPAAIAKLPGGTLFVPYYRGRPVFDAVRDLYEDGDPLKPEDGRLQMDVVTGEQCVVTSKMPIRITGIGETSGVTLMSVNQDVTGSYGCIGKHKQYDVPVSDSTKNLHVFALQDLVDRKINVKVRNRVNDGSSDGTVRYFAWMRSGRSGIDKLVLDVLGGKAKIDELDVEPDLEDTLCVLGLREGRRLQYVAWHCMPAREAYDNLMAWAQKVHRDDGSVLGVADVVRSCADVRRYAGSYDHWKGAEKYCPASFIPVLIAHIIEGHPFPAPLRRRVLTAYIAQGSEKCPNFHIQNQHLLMEI